jgi:LuxR family maltose regulon positive regulatory protein
MVYHASIALLDGNTESAVRWLKDVTALDLLSLWVPPPVVRLYWAQKGKAIEAEYMHKTYEHHVQHGGQALMIAVRIIQSLDSLGPENPLDCLSEALVLARPEGLIRMFTDFGMELVPLLHQAVSKSIEPEFARKLINIIEAEDRQRKIRKGELPSSSISSAILSEREMEVLHLMASGLSDRQISGKLVISLSTTKTHVHRILEKLNATSRMQAVTQAKELKLI